MPTLPRLALCAALLIPLAAQAVPESASPTAQAALARLAANSGGALQQVRDASAAYTLLRATGAQPLFADDASAEPLARAMMFLSLHGAALGVSDPTAQLILQRVSTDAAGNRHVHLAQRHQGLPVFGARMVMHMNALGVYGVNSTFVPDLAGLDTTPTLAIAQLRARALQAAAKLHPGAQLAIESTQLMAYRSGLLEGHHGKNYLAWEARVRSAAGDVREQLIFNAHNGGLINRISLVHPVLNREIYTPTQDVPPVLTEGAPSAPADPALVDDNRSASSTRDGDAPVNNLYIFAGGTYALYKNLFGREGYDDAARTPQEQVQKSVFLVNQQCPNAYWNGDSTNYCPGFDADDVVSHEWSHAYTEYTHGLVYQYQSGALNESYSDIFGEVYDLTNSLEGPLGANLAEGEYYENGGSRWVVGEDLSQEAAALILRDMWDPDAFKGLAAPANPSPGSVITSPNYFCGAGDGGGVHTNSGVPNHAFAMLVDGKQFNGVNIPAIGMVKAAQIYFQASSNYQTPTTNFSQHADALEQSCADLTGVDLNGITGAPSGERITPADCAAVAAAMQAVEMRQNPKQKCGYVPILQAEADTPAICPDGQFEFPDFSENWEGGSIPATWTQTQNLKGDTRPQPFEWVITDAAAPHTGKAVFADNNGFGSCTPGGDASASWSLDTPEISVVDPASFFRFTHYVQTEFGFDGGNLKYSINGAPFAVAPKTAFTHNPHSGKFNAAMGPTTPTGENTNPLAGQDAWTGSDQGESTGSWGVSIVDLAALGAKAGDKVKMRYDFGQDGCGGNVGWYVDEVALLHCSATPPPAAAPPASSTPADKSVVTGRFSGSLGLGLLLPLLGLLALRRRCRIHAQ